MWTRMFGNASFSGSLLDSPLDTRLEIVTTKISRHRYSLMTKYPKTQFENAT
jgi:hypothetical protein